MFLSQPHPPDTICDGPRSRVAPWSEGSSVTSEAWIAWLPATNVPGLEVGAPTLYSAPLGHAFLTAQEQEGERSQDAKEDNDR